MNNVMMMQRNESRKSIGERHIYTHELIKMLSDTNDGDVVTYEQMEKVIGLPTQSPGEGYKYQKSARDILEKESAIVFEVIDTVGLKRLSAEQVALSTAKMYTDRKKQSMKRFKRRISTVDDSYEDLSAEAKVKTTLARTLLAFDNELLKNKSVNRIESEIKEANKVIGFGDTLRLFNKP